MIQIVFTVLQRFIKLVGSFHLNYFLTMHIWPNVRIQTIVSKFQLLFLRGHKFLLSRKNIKNTVVFFISAFTYFHWKPHPPFIKMQWNRMTSLVINRNILTAVSKNIKQKSTENQPTKKKKNTHNHTAVCNIFLHNEFIQGMKSHIAPVHLPVV